MPTLLLLLVSQVVIMKTCCATSDYKASIMTTPGFQSLTAIDSTGIGNTSVIVQPPMISSVMYALIFPWKPPGHCLPIWTVTVVYAVIKYTLVEVNYFTNEYVFTLSFPAPYKYWTLIWSSLCLQMSCIPAKSEITIKLYVKHLSNTIFLNSWRRHQRKHFPRYWTLCGEFTGHRWIPPAQRPVTRSFDVFFDLCLE